MYFQLEYSEWAENKKGKKTKENDDDDDGDDDDEIYFDTLRSFGIPLHHSFYFIQNLFSLID